nr:MULTISPECIES: DUF192 domain-containing protein [Myxococcaceae]
MLLLAAGAARAVPPPRQAPVHDVSAQNYAAPPLPRGRVLLKDAQGHVHRVEVEIAATHASRTRGLMWRKELLPGHGMLFVFREDEVQSFWMRNTLIPLDMLFIDSSLRVVGILERAEPRTLSPRTVGRPGRYVLEVPGGWCASVGLAPGGRVELEGVEGLRVEP